MMRKLRSFPGLLAVAVAVLLAGPPALFGQSVCEGPPPSPATCGAPVARRDLFLVPPGTPSPVTLLVAPVANDSSASGRPLTLSCFEQPGGSTSPGPVTSRGDGTLLFSGTFPRAFNYRVLEEGGGTATGSVIVTSGFENGALPVLTPDSYTVEEGSAWTTLDVLVNDFNAPTAIASFSGNEGGVVIQQGQDRQFLSYQPVNCPGDPPCIDEFTYTVLVSGVSYPGTVQVTVVAPPPPPGNDVPPPRAVIEQLARDPNQGETQLFWAFDGFNSSRAFGGRIVTDFCWRWGDEPATSDPDACVESGQTVGCVYYPGSSRCYLRRERHAYPAPGNYTVKLRVRDSAGVWGEWTETELYIGNNPPIPRLQFSCFALSCSFDASASTDDFDTGHLEFDWGFGDASDLAHAASTTHTYPDLGTYRLDLIVTDRLGAARAIDTPVVLADRPPVARFTDTPCGDRCLSFTATTRDDFGLAGHEWRWARVADGLTGLLGVGPTAELRSATLGQYDVTLAATDGAGQTGTVTRRVELTGALRAATDWWILPPGATSVAFDPRANDTPGTGLTLTAWGQGTNGSVTLVGSTLRYQLTGARPSISDRFSYTVTNGAGQTALGTVRIVTRPIGEVGRVEGVTDVQRVVPFRQVHAAPPLVFALPASANDPEPAAARIVAVKPESFTVRIQEPGDGAHGAETVDYLVIVPPWSGATGSGFGNLEDGRAFAAGRFELSQTLGNGSGDSLDRWAWVTLPRSLGEAGPPVVLAQVQTANDPSWVTARVDRVTASGFRVALEVPEAASGHEPETVAWVAFPAGTSPVGAALLYEALDTGVKFSGGYDLQSFGRRYPVPPLVLGTLSSRKDGDPAVLRRRLVGVGNVELAVQEDATRDAEATHGAESASLLVFAEPAVLAGSTRTLLPADGGGLVGGDDRFTVLASGPSLLGLLANDAPGSGDLELLGFVQPQFGQLTRIVPGEPPPVGEPPANSWQSGGTPVLGGDVVYHPPSPEFRGWDAFEYTVRDGAGNRATLTAFVEVVGENEQ